MGSRSGPTRGLLRAVVSVQSSRNIYLHFVLDLWFEKKFKPTMSG